jgi:succinoglycan biosynthesis transport protein ExoP
VRKFVADSHANNNSAVQQGTSLGSWWHEVWRRKKIVAIVLATTVAAALAASVLAPKTYSASADVKVSTGNTSGAAQSAAEVSTVLATQVQVLLSTELAKDVEQRLGDKGDIVDVAVEGVPESQIATVTVKARTAEGAAKAANAYATAYDERRDRNVMQEATRRTEIVQRQVDELTTHLEDLQKQINEESARVNLEQARITVARENAARTGVVRDPESLALPNAAALSALQARYSDTVSQLSALRTQLREYQVAAELGDGGVAIVSTATVPNKPTGGGPVQTGLLAGLLGTGLGVGLALVAALRDRRLYDRAAVSRTLPRAQVVGTVRATTQERHTPVVVNGLVLPSPHSAIVDAYREVALVALQSHGDQAWSRLLIAGATREDSDTLAGGALAVALAGLGKRVLLIDGTGWAFGAGHASDAERADARTAERGLPQSITTVDVPSGGSLRILSRSDLGQAQHGVQGLARLTRALIADTDVVVVHGGPFLASSASLALVSEVDAVLLTVVLGTSTAPAVSETVSKIAAVGGRLLGVVLYERGSTAPSQSGEAVATSPPLPSTGAEDEVWIQPPPAVAARKVETSSRS